MPEEVRRKKSIAMIGKKLGHLSEETKRKISKIKKEKYSGENHPMYGKKQSEKAKEKMSLAKKKKV